MARFLPLFTVVVTHEFYDDAAAPNLRFAPSVAAAASMQAERLLMRSTVAGIEVWQEQSESLPDSLSAGPLHLSFDVFCSDPMMNFYTDWPVAPPVRFCSTSLPASRDREALQALSSAEASGEPQRKHTQAHWNGVASSAEQPVFSVDIEFHQTWPAGEEVNEIRQEKIYSIALKSKKIHWKYFFFGSLAEKKLSIVDLDAADTAMGLSFVPSPLTAINSGSAYLSESALPMQKLPRKRLQLREEGVAGKVLIRRLPNASIEKLGKERGPNGQSMIVAEIYIHQ